MKKNGKNNWIMWKIDKHQVMKISHEQSKLLLAIETRWKIEWKRRLRRAIYSLIRLMQSKPHEQKAFWPKIWLKNETKIKIMKESRYNHQKTVRKIFGKTHWERKKDKLTAKKKCWIKKSRRTSKKPQQTENCKKNTKAEVKHRINKNLKSLWS